MNGLSDKSRAGSHRRAQQLLPWYVNGTLEGPELDMVELHLEACDRCRRELDQQRSLAHALRTSDELAFSADRAFQQLRPRLVDTAEREEVPGAGSPSGLLDRLSESVAQMGAPMRWAFAVQLILVLALGAVLVQERISDPANVGEFRTLTQTPTATATAEGRGARVVFDSAASEGDIRELLVQSGSRVVDGPSAFGVYTVEIKDPSVLDRLRGSSLVVFAEPLGSERGSKP